MKNQSTVFWKSALQLSRGPDNTGINTVKNTIDTEINNTYKVIITDSICAESNHRVVEVCFTAQQGT